MDARSTMVAEIARRLGELQGVAPETQLETARTFEREMFDRSKGNFEDYRRRIEKRMAKAAAAAGQPPAKRARTDQAPQQEQLERERQEREERERQERQKEVERHHQERERQEREERERQERQKEVERHHQERERQEREERERQERQKEVERHHQERERQEREERERQERQKEVERHHQERERQEREERERQERQKEVERQEEEERRRWVARREAEREAERAKVARLEAEREAKEREDARRRELEERKKEEIRIQKRNEEARRQNEERDRVLAEHRELLEWFTTSLPRDVIPKLEALRGGPLDAWVSASLTTLRTHELVAQKVLDMATTGDVSRIPKLCAGLRRRKDETLAKLRKVIGPKSLREFKVKEDFFSDFESLRKSIPCEIVELKKNSYVVYAPEDSFRAKITTTRNNWKVVCLGVDEEIELPRSRYGLWNLVSSAAEKRVSDDDDDDKHYVRLANLLIDIARLGHLNARYAPLHVATKKHCRKWLEDHPDPPANAPIPAMDPVFAHIDRILKKA
ncbi:hypothetical protein CTAYLR_008255 [Chrysophaeum taylorii]|uniref:Uncharacterized protein n=1 Tax=Chrysophaeum taylorii TaxID=2483200 RepID=A0AAD7UF94_9STRA|nr:hypothetical protein CTAYLR_008255 [Chrysophaeum taylorii]